MTHNIEFTKGVLNNLWDRKPARKLDWLEYETELVSILQSDMSDADKLSASKELIDAFTRRGHFNTSEYLNK